MLMGFSVSFNTAAWLWEEEQVHSAGHCAEWSPIRNQPAHLHCYCCSECWGCEWSSSLHPSGEDYQETWGPPCWQWPGSVHRHRPRHCKESESHVRLELHLQFLMFCKIWRGKHFSNDDCTGCKQCSYLFFYIYYTDTRYAMILLDG